jgi:predicted O-methyltransferase YrrM
VPIEDAGVHLRNRRAWYRSRTLREVANAARWVLLRRDSPDLSHLPAYDEIVLGPVQRDEALLLYGLVRAIRPATVVEIGLAHGHNAYNLLRALDEDARLYSFDVDPICEQVAQRRFADDPRFAFRLRSQDEVASADLDGRPADFVFLDGAHDLDMNRATFERLLPLLSSHAIVAVHDTGTVSRRFMEDWREEIQRTERWIGDDYEPQPAERAFVNWVREAHPDFAQIHLHTDRVPRFGVTLLQRSGPLPRPPATGSASP